MSKTIIISNRLPVSVKKENDEFTLIPSAGGLATGLGSIYRSGNNVWIGWPGMEVNDADRSGVTDLLTRSNLLPVYLTAKEISEYYEGFSNEVLWPIFHYYASTHATYKQSNWDHYVSVNGKFADAVVKAAEPGDTIWIHDYQLLLLPGMLREALPTLSIGFFLHIPFPSFELFRLIPWRTELISGIMGADLVGFHTFDDVSHFLNAAKRLLTVNCSANEITVDGRIVIAEPFPMGIDSNKYRELVSSPAVQQHIQALQDSEKEAKMILSIDRLDYSKGILQRLRAFELLLEQYPEYISRVTLHMIVVPSRDKVKEYRNLKELVDRRVGEINSRFRTIDWNPINYFYRAFPIEELSALYAHAGICMVTPMRDGMNLVSKEYVASRINDTGVLILSEMAGASKELIDALIVNPSNIQLMTEAIVQGLRMSPHEQQRRMRLMRQVVSKFTVGHWVNLFLERLSEVKQLQHSMRTRQLSPLTGRAVRKIYQKTMRRIIFLDYDGTLVGFKSEIDLAEPDRELYDLLTTLTSDPANFVVIVSGRNHHTLEKWFGQMKLNLIAEHGAWQKRNGEWQSLPGLTDQWKQDIYPLLDTYVNRTPGAFIEEKDFSLVWHYRKVEPGLGELRTNELMNTLRYLTNDKGLQLLAGNKVVEIKNMEINKGRAALSLLHNQDYDFIMAMGDDHTDEDLFKVLPENSLTVKVGNHISSARFFLKGPAEVRGLLKSLIRPVTTPVKL